MKKKKIAQEMNDLNGDPHPRHTKTCFSLHFRKMATTTTPIPQEIDYAGYIKKNKENFL